MVPDRGLPHDRWSWEFVVDLLQYSVCLQYKPNGFVTVRNCADPILRVADASEHHTRIL